MPDVEVTGARPGCRDEEEGNGNGIQVRVASDGSRAAVLAFAERVGDLALHPMAHALFKLRLKGSIIRGAIVQDGADAGAAAPVWIDPRTGLLSRAGVTAG